MCRGALALYEVTADPAYRDAAIDWCATIERHYLDPQGGGYFLAADDTPGLITPHQISSRQCRSFGKWHDYRRFQPPVLSDR